MNPFLESVANYIFKNHNSELHQIAIVFPNKRARLFFNDYIGKLTKKPVFAPRYYTITEYMQQLIGTPMADQLTLLFTLYEVYISVTQSKESFDQFLYYCEMLLADFDDLDKYLVDANLLYKNLSDLKEIEAYYEYLDESQIKAIETFWKTFAKSKDSSEKQKFSSLWDVLFKIYIQFNNKLNELGLAYEGGAYRKAIEQLKEGKISIQDKHVAFVGFNALNECEKVLFNHLKAQNKGIFFWDYDDYYIGKKDFHEAAYFLSDLIKTYPAPEEFSFHSNLKKPERKIKIYDIATTTGQAKALPLALNNLPKDWKEKPLKTAIALADETLLIPVLNALPSEIGEVNISMGYPLKETRIYSLIQTLIELHKNKKGSSKKEELFYHTDVTKILQFGLLNTDNNNQLDLTKNISKHNLVYVNSADLIKLNGIYAEIFKPGITPANFVEYLITLLTYIPKYFNPENTNTYTIEKEAGFRIITQLNRICDILKTTTIVFNFVSLTKLLAKILEGSSIPFKGEPLLGIQIMGILETRNIDFDNLIILSMNEGVFPKSGNVPSFIPYTLRKGFRMPTIEHQDAIFAYYFYRLLQRSKNVTLIYSSSVNDMKSGEPSRFIHQLTYEDAFNIEKETLTYKVNPVSERNILIKKTPETLKILTKTYCGEKKRALSPSAINTYLNCKTRFYYRYIAGIKEPDTILEEVEANTLGSILHRTMELLYEPYVDALLTEVKIQEILKDKNLLEIALLKSFWEEYLSPETEFPGIEKVKLQGKNILIKEVIKRYIISILEHDKKETPIKIIGLEEKYYSNFTTKNKHGISVGGVIDRIDEKEGLVRIIDYKTGRLKDSFSDIEQLFYYDSSMSNDAAFQTILYALVLDKETNNKEVKSAIQPGLYFVRNIRNKNYSSNIIMGKGKTKKPILKLDEVKSEFEEYLSETLNDIFSDTGEFTQTEDIKYCEYCPYKEICGR